MEQELLWMLLVVGFQAKTEQGQQLSDWTRCGGHVEHVGLPHLSPTLLSCV